MLSIMCATFSARSSSGLPRSPIAMIATPAKTENTTICKISPSAIALNSEVGTRWSTKLSMLKAWVDRLAVLTPLSAISMPTPGWRMLTISTEQQRHDRSGDEPTHRLGADPADRRRIAHMPDSDDQRRQHQRADDHLDQPQEDRADQRHIPGDISRRRFVREGVKTERAED